MTAAGVDDRRVVENVRTVDVLIVGGGATGAGILRDLARRGLRCLLVDKGDLGTGTSGRYHGLLHSGGRYVARDASAARECIAENRILRLIAPGCIEDSGGLFVATPADPDDYVEAFPGLCATAGVPCEEVPVAEVFRREPALDRRIRRAFRVPDASLEPWQLIEGNLQDARALGSDALPYRQVVAMERTGDAITSVSIADVRSGTVDRIAPRLVVSATGAWAGMVAELAGVRIDMSPGMGTMLVYNQRMTDMVINRCHVPGDGDIMVPVHTVAILGTTEIRVDDPDRYQSAPGEIAELIEEGEKLFPDLRRMRILRAYAGVRPLFSEKAASGGDGREISRSHVVLDHEPRDGVSNFVSIVGGKLTTYRLMAEHTSDVVAAKLGLAGQCETATEVLPAPAGGTPYYWLGDRLAEHEATGGGDAALICECELVTRPMLERFLAQRWPCSLDDVRRGTRLGMGPCQGAFCTFRAAGIVAEEVAARRLGAADAGYVDPPAAGEAFGTGRVPGPDAVAESGDAEASERELAAISERAIVAFLRERYKGMRPVAWGRQLQELWLTAGTYWGVLGVDTFEPQAEGLRRNASDASSPAAGRDRGASRAADAAGGLRRKRKRRVEPGGHAGTHALRAQQAEG